MPFEAVEQGIRLFVKLTPAAKKTALAGSIVDSDEKAALKITVTAVAEKNKANVALIKFMARALGMARSDIEILFGHTDRRKTLLLRGEPKALEKHITNWMKQENV